jgi:hypothetical protein
MAEAAARVGRDCDRDLAPLPDPLPAARGEGDGGLDPDPDTDPDPDPDLDRDPDPPTTTATPALRKEERAGVHGGRRRACGRNDLAWWSSFRPLSCAPPPARPGWR